MTGQAGSAAKKMTSPSDSSAKFGDQLVAGIEHRATAGQHDIDLGPVDVAVASCSTRRHSAGHPSATGLRRRRVDIGDDAHRAAVVGQAFAEDDAAPFSITAASTARLSSRRRPDAQLAHRFSGPGGGRGMQAVAAGQAGALAGEVNQVGDQLGDGGLAMRAGDADQRNAAAFAFGKQVVDNGLADRARLADARGDVHQQAGAGIDLDDGAALFGERPGNVLADEIDAGDVETDDPGCQRSQRGGVRMDFVGAVEGMVGVALDQDFAARPERRRVRAFGASSMRAAESMWMIDSGCSSVEPRRGSVLIWVSISSRRSTCPRRSP
jgi:hypothetical protein